jgi:diguanylate cyclase (GGDEF)-like protein
MAVRLKVLIVDDDDVSRTALARVVASFGHECRCAQDGLEALQMHQAERADVILSDWDMPIMDGLELCRRTRVEPDEQGYTHFIFVTAFDGKERFLRGMEVGADDYQTKPVDLDELQARLVSAGRVVALHRKLAEMNRGLRRDSRASFVLARVDALTGVANRLRLEEDLPQLLAQAKRYGHRYSAVICDVDWFKVYNDHFGHIAGDEALRRVAQSMAGELRCTDQIYRYGGEEFLLVLPQQSLLDAMTVAERVCRAVERQALPTVVGRGVMTVSAGVAELRRSDETARDWLARADAALYRAKAEGRNRAIQADAIGQP